MSKGRDKNGVAKRICHSYGNGAALTKKNAALILRLLLILTLAIPPQCTFAAQEPMPYNPNFPGGTTDLNYWTSPHARYNLNYLPDANAGFYSGNLTTNTNTGITGLNLMRDFNYDVFTLSDPPNQAVDWFTGTRSGTISIGGALTTTAADNGNLIVNLNLTVGGTIRVSYSASGGDSLGYGTGGLYVGENWKNGTANGAATLTIGHYAGTDLIKDSYALTVGGSMVVNGGIVDIRGNVSIRSNSSLGNQYDLVQTNAVYHFPNYGDPDTDPDKNAWNGTGYPNYPYPPTTPPTPSSFDPRNEQHWGSYVSAIGSSAVGVGSSTGLRVDGGGQMTVGNGLTVGRYDLPSSSVDLERYTQGNINVAGGSTLTVSGSLSASGTEGGTGTGSNINSYAVLATGNVTIEGASTMTSNGNMYVWGYSTSSTNPAPAVTVSGNSTLKVATGSSDLHVGGSMTVAAGSKLDVAGDVIAHYYNGSGLINGSTFTVDGDATINGDVLYTNVVVSGTLTGSITSSTTTGTITGSRIIAWHVSNSGIIRDFRLIEAPEITGSGIFTNIGTIRTSRIVNGPNSIIAHIHEGINVSSYFLNAGLIASVGTISDRWTTLSDPPPDSYSDYATNRWGQVTLQNFGGTIRDADGIEMWGLANIGLFPAAGTGGTAPPQYYNGNLNPAYTAYQAIDNASNDFARIVDVRQIVTISDVLNQGTGAIIDGHPIARTGPTSMSALAYSSTNANNSPMMMTWVTPHGIHGTYGNWYRDNGDGTATLVRPPNGATPDKYATPGNSIWDDNQPYFFKEEAYEDGSTEYWNINNHLEGGYHYDDRTQGGYWESATYNPDGSIAKPRYWVEYDHSAQPLNPAVTLLDPTEVSTAQSLLHAGRDLLNLDEALICDYRIEVERDVFNVGSRISVGSYAVNMNEDQSLRRLYQTGVMVAGRDIFNVSQKKGGTSRMETQYSVIENFLIVAAQGNVINGENAIITAGRTNIDPYKDQNNIAVDEMKYQPNNMRDYTDANWRYYVTSGNGAPVSKPERIITYDENGRINAISGLYAEANTGRRARIVNGVMLDGVTAPWGYRSYVWNTGDIPLWDSEFFYDLFSKPYNSNFVAHSPTILDVYGSLYNNGLIQSIDALYVGHDNNDPNAAKVLASQQNTTNDNGQDDLLNPVNPDEQNDSRWIYLKQGNDYYLMYTTENSSILGIKTQQVVTIQDENGNSPEMLEYHGELFKLNVLYNDKQGMITDIGVINTANLTNLGKIIDIKTTINVAYDLTNAGIIDGATTDDNGTAWNTSIKIGGNLTTYPDTIDPVTGKVIEQGSVIKNVRAIDVAGDAELAGQLINDRRIDVLGKIDVKYRLGSLAVDAVPADTAYMPAKPAVPAKPQVIGVDSHTTITSGGNFSVLANKEDLDNPTTITSVGVLVTYGSIISEGKIINEGVIKNNGSMRAAAGITNTGKNLIAVDPRDPLEREYVAEYRGRFINEGALFIENGGFVNRGRFEGIGGDVYLQGSKNAPKPSPNNFVNESDGTVATGNTIHGNFYNNEGTIEVDMTGNKVNVLRVTDGTAVINGGKVRYIVDDSKTGAWSYLKQGDQYLFLEVDTPLQTSYDPNKLVDAADPSNPENYDVFLDVNQQRKLTYEGGVDEVLALVPKYGRREADRFVEDENWRQYYWMEVSRVRDYAPYAVTLNQVAFGEYLDKVGTQYLVPNSDFWNLLAKLDTVTADQNGIVDQAKVLRALDEMSGAIYSTIGTASVFNISAVNQTMADVLRSDVFKFSYHGNPNNAYRGQTVAPHRWSRWGTGFGVGGSSQNDGNASGYSQSVGGVIVGVDRAFSSGTRFGGYFSGADGTVSLKDLNEKTRSQEFLVGLYLRQEMYFGYTLASLGFGNNTYKTDRNLNLLQYTASNKHSGSTAMFYIERGIDIPFYYGAIQPFASFQAASIRQSGFTESMNRLIDHNGLVDGRLANTGLEGLKNQTDSFRLSFGSRTSSGPITLPWGQAAVSLDLAWFHEFSNRNDRDANLRITDAGGANYITGTPLSFKVFGNESKQDWINGGLGVHLDRNSTRVFFDVDVFANDRQTLFTGNGGFITSW